VTDVFRKVVKRYQMLPNRDLVFIEAIENKRAADNIEYDSKSGKFYLGNIVRLVDYLRFTWAYQSNGFNWPRSETSFAGGASEMVKIDGKWVARELFV
jgi:hypothetical protein